jgi:zinc protease
MANHMATLSSLSLRGWLTAPLARLGSVGRSAVLLLGLLQTGAAFATLPIQHWTQSSGAKVYLVESRGLPMLDVQIDFDAGERRDPKDKAGLAMATARMSSKGIAATGTLPALDENQLSEAWADLGAALTVSSGNDRLSFVMRSLSYPDVLSEAVQLAARQLGQPLFPEVVWLRQRAQMSAALREANTRPATVAGKAFAAAVYGDHPYGYQSTEETLTRIGVADIRQFYAQHIAPCRAKVSLVGDINQAEATALVDKLLARLPQAGACMPLAAVPEVAPLAAPVTRVIAFASAQAHVLIGQPGYKRSDPDFFALTVGNYTLGGGGFVSRLTEEVREKRGLTYSVYSFFAPGLHAGAFTIGLQTRPDQAAQAVEVARGVLAKFVAEGPTEAELKAAKDNLIGGFALRLDSNAKLLDNVANIAWNNLPLNYLNTWTAQVEKITAADIRAAFARKLQPGRMVTVVLGAPS